MFIIDGTTDLAAVLARLARLMYNIERGAKVYEWTPGSDAAPLPKPQPGFLSIEVPGETVGAPPTIVDYRPAAAFIYYVPGAELDLPALVSRLRTLMEAFPDDHLLGYLPVEVAPHVTLLHRGRVFSGAETTGARSPYTKGWYPGELYPARHFHTIGSRAELEESPSHVSYRGAFTWYLAPISAVAKITRLESFEDFNAVVASVFLDTFLGGKETPEPMYNITASFFNVEPVPPELADTETSFPNAILVARGDRFGAVGQKGMITEALANWHDPAADRLRQREDPSAPLPVANLPRALAAGVEAKCGSCGAPLWGDVYAVTDDLIAPHYMAICEWCCGCYPPERRSAAVQVPSGRTLREACQGTSWESILPILEAEIEVIQTAARVFFLVTLASGKRLIIEPSEGFSATTPACLRAPELRDLRVSSIEWTRLAIAPTP